MSYSPLELNGKVAVVVGGTSGIGRAIACGLAEAGADVVPTSRRMEQVEAAAADIEERGHRTLRVNSDVADRASLQRVLDESIKAFGKVDILVNSAGRTKRAPTLDFSEEDWNDILETNLMGTLRACQVDICSSVSMVASSTLRRSQRLSLYTKWPPIPPAKLQSPH
jgi:NAD(P)-dependent dehydrogenase (short-subunit alcohol dehydrogenase family)